MPGLTITFEVTEEDIRTGKRGSCKNCPIAKALRRAFPEAFSVHVSPGHDMQSGIWWSASIQSFKGSLLFNLPQDMSEKASRFDREGVMEPFAAEVMVL